MFYLFKYDDVYIRKESATHKILTFYCKDKRIAYVIIQLITLVETI